MKVIDRTDHKYNMLEVLRRNGSKKGQAAWECKCDCGNIITVGGEALHAGQLSCGCVKSGIGYRSKFWKGYGEISSTKWSHIKNHAINRRQKSFSFLITIEYAWDLFLKQNRKCALTGLQLSFNTLTSKWDGTASLDRIDNTKGYIEGNVQWVHKWINLMKLDHSQEEFISWCKLVAEYNS